MFYEGVKFRNNKGHRFKVLYRWYVGTFDNFNVEIDFIRLDDGTIFKDFKEKELKEKVENGSIVID